MEKKMPEEHEHKFVEFTGAGYHKVKQGADEWDTTVSYAMVFCRKCGETRELISRDERKAPNLGTPGK
jgi:hypothetical protein